MKKGKILSVITLLLLLVSCTNVKSDKYIGSWISFKTDPPSEGWDQSMIGQIAHLIKYPNTNETYIFNIWGSDMMMIKDGDKLIDIYGTKKFILELDVKNDILVYQQNISDTDTVKIYHKRLK
jgi:hypothetical protein